MIRLATEWAKLGHEVTNFVPVKESDRYFEPQKGFHEYVPIKLAQPMLESFPFDAVVAWECPSIYNSEAVRDKQKVRLVHMQVAHLADQEREAAEKYSTGVVALSPWARDFLVHDGLEMPEDKLYVRPNGVDITNYPWVEKSLPKDRPVSFVYSSSPDRGLWHLLKIWPLIREEFPDAMLYVTYGVEKYVAQTMWAHNRLGEMSLDIIEGMLQPGVIDLGKIGQKKLAELQMKATAWLYPADTIQATETGCITAIENMAAGNPCIMSDADCLKDEFESVSDIVSLPFDAMEFFGVLVEILNDPLRYKCMSTKGRKFAEIRDWGVIAPTWIDLFKEQSNAT